jgi:hypothetical protein
MVIRAQLFIAAVLLASTATVQAVDLPVRYTVEKKALKAAVTGTPLTFQLFTDGACTSLTFSQTFPVDVVEIVQLRFLKPSGSSMSAPKAAELRYVLHAVPTVAPLYLKVSGAGVIPEGEDCQAQAITFAPAAPPVPGTSFVVKDANNTVVATYIGAGPIGLNAMRAFAGAVVELTVAQDTISGTGRLVYDNPTCQDPPLMTLGVLGSLGDVAVVIGTEIYYQAGPLVPQPTLYEKGPGGICSLSGPGQAAPTISEDISGLTPPFRVTTP